jgi:glycosyltransferase involved in cell wall biosynthesis
VAWHHDLAWTQERYRCVLHEGRPWDLLRTPWPGVEQVTVSSSRRAELAGLLGIAADSIRVVRNGLDVAAELALDPETVRITDWMRVLERDPVLLTPTRLLPRKNIELALSVVAGIRRMGRPAALLVSGPVDPHDPAAAGYLRRLLALRTDLDLDGAAWFVAVDAGAVPSDRVVSDLYRLADALFLPSREEGFGLPVLEAALHRLPIVATDLPVLREVAGEAATWLDPDGDPDVIARAVIARLEADPEASLWRRVRREYSWPAVYRDEIEPLLSAGP